MHCGACQYENRQGSAYCGACGAQLGQVCPACRRECPPDHAFCDGCGTALRRPPERSRSQAKAPSSEGAAERRQLTVLFCDLVGSTALSERLDAEELREVMRAYHETGSRVVEELEGHVAQYLGDGLLVYFGYPQAHEDDAVRAMNAALTLQEELPRLSERLRDRHPEIGALRIRVGVHTGPVVVGETGGGKRSEQLALGETVNVASRLLLACEPGQVVISDATRSLSFGAFLFEEVGERSFKGLSGPIGVHRVVGRSGVESRLDLAESEGLTPLVGREQEMALLLDRWESAREGRGRAVLVRAEAGMGKSRLIRALRERLAGVPHRWLEARASTYRQDSALYPTLRLLERAFGFGSDDAPAQKLVKLETALERLTTAGGQPSETLPLLADLLSLPRSEGAEALTHGAEEKRRRTFQALAGWLLSESESQPVVLVMEDLHWIDPSSLELVGLLLDQLPTARVLMLLTFRPSFAPPWPERAHRLDVTLHPLTHKQIEAMMSFLAAGKALPTTVVEQLAGRTDGVPLFVEELTRSVLESELLRETDRSYERTDPLPALAIPTTLQDSLMARLDRLGPAKELAQCASVLGREFPHDLLDAISPLRGPDLEKALEVLREAELLYRRGSPPRAVYSFKHALIQRAAYESLLKSRRRQLHGAIADALKARFAERTEAEPEMLARHCQEAGRTEEALVGYEQAGEQAAARYAHAEAAGHVKRAIAMLQSQPETPERHERELLLQLSLGRSLGCASGFQHPETERTWRRARRLCEQAGHSAQLRSALGGLFTVHMARFEMRSAAEIADLLVRVAERSESSADLFDAHVVSCIVSLYRGEPARCVHHMERAVVADRSDRSDVGMNPMHATRIFGALGRWFVGHPDRALSESLTALEEARAFGQPAGLVGGQLLAIRLLLWRRELAPARALAEECCAAAEESQMPFFIETGSFLRCATLADADPNAAVERMQQTMNGPAAESMRGDPWHLGLMAEALDAAGRRDEALRTLDIALAASDKGGTHYWDAELLRRRGDLLLARDDADPREAESSFECSLEIARSQGALSLELRTAASLARLRQRQGRAEEASALLTQVYGRFTEGFDTPDLVKARALLGALG